MHTFSVMSSVDAPRHVFSNNCRVRIFSPSGGNATQISAWKLHSFMWCKLAQTPLTIWLPSALKKRRTLVSLSLSLSFRERRNSSSSPVKSASRSDGGTQKRSLLLSLRIFISFSRLRLVPQNAKRSLSHHRVF